MSKGLLHTWQAKFGVISCEEQKKLLPPFQSPFIALCCLGECLIVQHQFPMNASTE